MRNHKFLLLFFLLSLAFSLPATANTCNSFASYTCAKSTPNVVHLNGSGMTGQSVGILLGNTFTVTIEGNKSFAGDELILLAAAPNGLTGTVNGISFTSLSSFAEGAAMGAITDTWNGLGISSGASQFGYANVGTIGSIPFSITASGVASGTILYAEILNPTTGQILYITPNSEAGILKGGSQVTPEPASLTLFGTGLAGLAALVRRKLVKS